MMLGKQEIVVYGSLHLSHPGWTLKDVKRFRKLGVLST